MVASSAVDRSNVALTSRVVPASTSAVEAAAPEAPFCVTHAFVPTVLASALGAPGEVLPILCRPDDVRALVPLPPSVTVVGWPSGVKHVLSGSASPYLVARTATFMAKKMAEAILGRPVDLLTRAMLHDRIRDSALSGAVTLYDAA